MTDTKRSSDVMDRNGVEELELVLFEESPFAEGFESDE